MGYYIEVPEHKGKAEQIIRLYGARRVSYKEASVYMSTPPPHTEAVICIIDNGPFEAAGFCYDLKEFREFTEDILDPRPRSYLMMDRELAEKLTGYSSRNERRSPSW